MDKLYLIKTNTYISNKKYHNYWIEKDYIKDFITVADSPQSALNKLCDYINAHSLGVITNNARQNIEPIYRDIYNDAIQVGYIIKMWTDIDDTNICCDLWCEIFTLANFDKQ